MGSIWGKRVQSKYSRKAGKTGWLAVCALVLSAVAAGLLLYQSQSSQLSNEEVRTAAALDATDRGHSTGSILMRGGADGACRRMRFDNVTGTLTQDVDTACNDKTPGINSTEGRMNAIRDAFSKK
jgi:hypothetical protein